MQEQLTDSDRLQYLIKTNPWPKEVYDAMVLQRNNQLEVLDKYITSARKKGNYEIQY